MSIDNPIDDLEKENKRLKKKLEKTESEISSLSNRWGKLRLEGYNYRAEIKRLKEENESLKVIDKEVKRLNKEVKEKEEQLAGQSLEISRLEHPHRRYNPDGTIKPNVNPLGLILWVGFILLMLYLFFAN